MQTSRSAIFDQLKVRSSRQSHKPSSAPAGDRAASLTSRSNATKRESSVLAKPASAWNMFEETIKGIDDVPHHFDQHYRPFSYSRDFKQILNDINYKLPEVKSQHAQENTNRSSTTVMGADDMVVQDVDDVTEHNDETTEERSTTDDNCDVISVQDSSEDSKFIAVTEMASGIEDIRRKLYDRYLSQSNHWAGNLKRHLPQAFANHRERTKSAAVSYNNRNTIGNSMRPRSSPVKGIDFDKL